MAKRKRRVGPELEATVEPVTKVLPPEPEPQALKQEEAVASRPAISPHGGPVGNLPTGQRFRCEGAVYQVHTFQENLIVADSMEQVANGEYKAVGRRVCFSRDTLVQETTEY